MRWISFLLVISPALVFGATYQETRNVVDSAGKKFKCTYKLNYSNQNKFNKAKSSATCTPKKSGKVVTETFDIESIGKSVTVKHKITKGKKTITSIVVKDYVAPTTTAAPGPALDMTHDCTCKMTPDSQGNLLTSVRAALPAVVNRQLFGGGLLGNLVPAPAPAPAGLDLASLLGGGGGSNDLVTNLAMQVAQQQINDFINNGGAEDAITNLVESGQLEEMVTNFVESGQAEEMVGQMMENVDMEQMVGQAMENVNMEEMMDGMVGNLEQQMAENMENGDFGALGEMMQSLESMEMNGGLEELMANMENMEGGLMSPDMMAQLGNMQLNMQCACTTIA
jgi:hypothetical protein